MSTAMLDLVLDIQPYPGLRPFREDETHLYFGREQHRGELLKRLTATRFVAVIGTSGSGKSSLVRAGLLPDLLSGYLAGTGSDWVIVESRPGVDPIGRLAAAFENVGWVTDANTLRTDSSHILDLATRHLVPGQHVLVLVDQFEELFRLRTSEDHSEDADEKAAFVRLLLNAGGQRTDVTAQHSCVHVVMAMRSEFLGRASVYRGLPEAIDQGQYLIPRLSREQLRKAIESPARVAGGELEEALVQRLLNELGDDQDQLPVLQHALMRCWQLGSGDGPIGLEAYDRSGQLATALSLDANEALAESRAALGARAEQIVKRVFQALRETDVNGGQTRRPTAVDELCELAGCTIDELTTALAPFRRRSFVVPPPDTPLENSTPLDISHEALLRRWDKLRGWIEEDDQDRSRYVRLATRAADEHGSERPQYLVTPLLDLLLKFWADRDPPRAWAVRHHSGYERARAFLDESEKHRRDREEETAKREAEEARQKQALADAVAKRAHTRRRALVGSILAITVLVGAGLALRKALEQGARLEALLIGARLASVPETKTEARLQLTAEVAKRRQDLESRQELLKALFLTPTPKEVAWDNESATDALSVAISPNDDVLYAAAGDRLRAIELASGQERLSIPLSGFRGEGYSDTPIILASGDKLLVLWNRLATVVDGRTLTVLGEQIPDARAFSVSSNGGHAAFLVSNRVSLCRLSDNCESRPQYDVNALSLPDLQLSVSDLELSADGRHLVLVGEPVLGGTPGEEIGRSVESRWPLALFDTSPWRARKVRLVAGLEPLSVAVDAQHVHVCTPDSLRQYDAYDDTLAERVVRQFTPRAERCRIFGEKTVTSHADGAIRVWDEIGTLVTQTQAAAGVGAAWRMALGERTLVASTERLEAWDLTPYGRQNVSARLLGWGRGNAFAYGSDTLVELDSGAVTSRPKLDLGDRLPLAVSDSLELAVFRARQAGYSRSGEYVTEELFLMTLRPGAVPQEGWHWSTDKGETVTGITFTPDERHVAIETRESGKASLKILDAADGKSVRELPGRSFIFFTPTNELLAWDGSKVVVVSLQDGNERVGPEIKLPSEYPVVVAFSRDGRAMALAVPGSQTGAVEVFEWPGFRRVAEPLQHPANLTSLSFGPDGLALLTSTTDGTAHVWDLPTGEETLRIPAPGPGATAVFTPRGQIAIRDDSGLTVLPADPEKWVAEACRRIVRNLTPDEWTLFVGNDVEYQTTCPDRP